jgi:NAD(P)-dependent dehydrogenase (short-subunit alcohol dehydrogenase family)
MVSELLQDPQNFVIATARAPSASSGLQALTKQYDSSRLHILTLDVTSPSSISSAASDASSVLPNGLDNLIANAGINHQSTASFDSLDLDLFREEFEMNTISIINLLRSFLPLIRKSSTKKITILTSQLGSVEIGFKLPGLANAYSISKAALNMLARKWAAVLKMEGVTMFLVHPGWVETDIGNEIEGWMSKYAPQAKKLSTEASAKGVVKVAGGVTLEDAGNFYNVDGTNIPF